MRKYYYRKILIALFVINIVGICAVYFKYCRNVLPNAIELTMGEKACLKYDVPAVGMVKDQKIKLNQPFVLTKDSVGQDEIKAKLFGAIPLKDIKVNVVKQKTLVPSGKIVGIYVETNGILVLETDMITGVDGGNHSPSSNKLYQGDYILSVNGSKVETKVDFMKKINECNGKEVTLEVIRNHKKTKIKVKPVQSVTDSQYKIGAWVRDNTQGIGTMTYVAGTEFGGLGHGICDMDTGKLMDIKGGYLLTPQIDTIQKGKSGSPGEIVGSIFYKEANLLGTIRKNTKYGIYGTTQSDKKDKAYRIGYKQSVKKGKAQIISCISGRRETYDIEIKSVDQSNHDVLKGMEIEITDPKLLKLTNGIVQGMSGTPIIQNNHIIGAVTHVFVDDSTKGYATFIENMLNSSNKMILLLFTKNLRRIRGVCKVCKNI